MSAWDLPESAELNGREYAIRSDFRCILDVIKVMADRELDGQDKTIICLMLFYPDFEDMDRRDWKAAVEYMNWFVNGGEEQKGGRRPRLMDWDQDAALVVSPINRVLGFECRSCEHLHWWTFLGAYMEIGDCLFAQVVSIRKKKAKGAKLDKSDRDFYRRNRHLVDFNVKATEEEEQLASEWIG